MPKPTYILTIDPGQNIGWALWDWEYWDTLVPPIRTGVQVKTTKTNWFSGLKVTHKRFQRMIERQVYLKNLSTVYIEEPYYAEGGTALASAKSGALVKLSIAVGWLVGYFSTHGVQVELVSVQAWKGQLSKELVAKRIQRKLGKRAAKIKSHAIDATGIGLYKKGFFNESR